MRANSKGGVAIIGMWSQTMKIQQRGIKLVVSVSFMLVLD